MEVPDSNIYHESWLREKLEDSASLKCKLNSFINVIISHVIAEWPESKENKKMLYNIMKILTVTDLYNKKNWPWKEKEKGARLSPPPL